MFVLDSLPLKKKRAEKRAFYSKKKRAEKRAFYSNCQVAFLIGWVKYDDFSSKNANISRGRVEIFTIRKEIIIKFGEKNIFI